MNQLLRVRILLGILATTACLCGCATGRNGDIKADARERMIDARAETQLTRMCNFLAKQPALTFSADILYEDYLVDDHKVQDGRTATVEFRRPNKLRAQAAGDTESRRYWFDGSKVSILDETANLFARLDVPGTYDQMLATMSEKYALSMTLGEFLLSDPHTELLDDVLDGSYLGLRTVGGQRCHQLAFREAKLDWQIWIDAGAQPWPRKLVVTYKTLPAYPQFSATFTRWDANASTQDSDYAFSPPANAVEIGEIEPLPTAGSTKSK